MGLSPREKLENKARELSLDPKGLNDSELTELINQAQNENAPQQPPEDEPDNEDTHYYRTEVYGLKVVVGDPDPTKGEVAPRTVGFTPYFEELRGREGRVKIGYLKTDEGSAIKKLDEDVNVEEITKKEYDEATTFAKDKKGKPIAGVRAPY